MDAVAFLSQMLKVWKDHCSQMLTIRSIFLYLDRTYVISSSTVRSIFDMGLDCFRTHLQSLPEVSHCSAAQFEDISLSVICHQSHSWRVPQLLNADWSCYSFDKSGLYIITMSTCLSVSRGLAHAPGMHADSFLLLQDWPQDSGWDPEVDRVRATRQLCRSHALLRVIENADLPGPL